MRARARHRKWMTEDRLLIDCAAEGDEFRAGTGQFSQTRSDWRPETCRHDRRPFLLRDDALGIATLTLNRPQSRNGLSLGMLQALKGALAAIAADAETRVVVIAGAGPAFCAGHDLKELRGRNYDPAYVDALFALCAEVMQAIVRLPKPVIARVHGVATAAGAQLVASCDLAFAAADARFATPGSISACSARRPWSLFPAMSRRNTPCRCCCRAT